MIFFLVLTFFCWINIFVFLKGMCASSSWLVFVKTKWVDFYGSVFIFALLSMFFFIFTCRESQFLSLRGQGENRGRGKYWVSLSPFVHGSVFFALSFSFSSLPALQLLILTVQGDMLIWPPPQKKKLINVITITLIIDCHQTKVTILERADLLASGFLILEPVFT